MNSKNSWNSIGKIFEVTCSLEFYRIGKVSGRSVYYDETLSLTPGKVFQEKIQVYIPPVTANAALHQIVSSFSTNSNL